MLFVLFQTAAFVNVEGLRPVSPGVCACVCVYPSPFFPRAEPANTQPVEDSAMILKDKKNQQP